VTKSLQKRILLLTGSPGIGKTTVLMKVVDVLRESGISVGGMISREVRKNGVRLGFEILEPMNNKRGWLAHIDQKDGPQVGKYRVNLHDLEGIGAAAIIEATEKCSVIVIDEIGPMELFSKKFKKAVKLALESGKIVMAVIHAKASDVLVDETKQREDSMIFAVTLNNRETLTEELVNQVLGYFSRLCV
jgi:nucleoside-triphosphatase